ncbi:Acyl-CoA-binding protein-like [Papilio xuthus]|uniref:Acyl-CoA-binding protein-like n=2 Tax=Papilio xuthus TaxID=66420 RepID=A0A194Q3L7_PAPXU|nr:Acyl-CoA-binding protein-like [Papilio xuthus]
MWLFIPRQLIGYKSKAPCRARVVFFTQHSAPHDLFSQPSEPVNSLNLTYVMSLQEQFDQAAANVRNLKSLPSDGDLLELYALFKQATTGDADPANRPGMFDLKGKAKFDAWSKKNGMSKEDAQKAYIAKVESLVASIGLQ